MRRGGVSESIEAERALLGAVLVTPALLPAVSLSAGDFGEPRLRAVFAAVATLDADQTGVDLVTVKNELQRTGKMEAAGGVGYVAGLLDGIPTVTPETLARWEKVVRDGAKLRRVKDAAAIMARVAEDTGNSADALDEARRLLDETERHVLSFDIDSAAGVREAHRNLLTPASEARGIRTGIPGLDRILRPSPAPGNVLIIAARPGGGKSAIAAQIAENVARSGKGVLFVSAEMTRSEIHERRILCESGLSVERIRRGLSLKDARALNEAVEAIAARPFYVIEGTPTPTEIRAQARMVAGRAHGLGVVVVDYLQLLAPAAGKFQTREGNVSETSRALKGLGGALSVPVVACCQLNRDVEKRENSEPRKSDLRESGSLEQDAHQILFLHRGEDSSERVIAVLGKNRNGAEGRTELRFRGEVFRFESPAHEGEGLAA
ncbi:MAG: AAA family ATPase [Vicinamibacteria bacterium]|nr:AAA family ATPase [Vicinamibacteria bacterium]